MDMQHHNNTGGGNTPPQLTFLPQHQNTTDVVAVEDGSNTAGLPVFAHSLHLHQQQHQHQPQITFLSEFDDGADAKHVPMTHATGGVRRDSWQFGSQLETFSSASMSFPGSRRESVASPPSPDRRRSSAYVSVAAESSGIGFLGGTGGGPHHQQDRRFSTATQEIIGHLSANRRASSVASGNNNNTSPNSGLDAFGQNTTNNQGGFEQPKASSPDGVASGAHTATPSPTHGTNNNAAPIPGSINDKNVFVTGLPVSVNDTSLQTSFRKYGKVLSAKVMLDIKTGVSRGFGFILFERSSDAAESIAALQGKPTLPGIAADPPVEGRPPKVLQLSYSRHRGENLMVESNNVHVRNIPSHLTEQFLTQHFSHFGEVTWVSMRRDSIRVVNPDYGKRSSANSSPMTMHAQFAQTAMVDDTVAAPQPVEPPELHLRSVVVIFADPSAARACVENTHGKMPWKDCRIAVMAKIEEPHNLRVERLRQRGELRGSTNSPNNNNHTPTQQQQRPGSGQQQQSPPTGRTGTRSETSSPQQQQTQQQQGHHHTTVVLQGNHNSNTSHPQQQMQQHLHLQQQHQLLQGQQQPFNFQGGVQQLHHHPTVVGNNNNALSGGGVVQSTPQQGMTHHQQQPQPMMNFAHLQQQQQQFQQQQQQQGQHQLQPPFSAHTPFLLSGGFSGGGAQTQQQQQPGFAAVAHHPQQQQQQYPTATSGAPFAFPSSVPTAMDVQYQRQQQPQQMVPQIVQTPQGPMYAIPANQFQQWQQQHQQQIGGFLQPQQQHHNASSMFHQQQNTAAQEQQPQLTSSLLTQQQQLLALQQHIQQQQQQRQQQQQLR